MMCKKVINNSKIGINNNQVFLILPKTTVRLTIWSEERLLHLFMISAPSKPPTIVCLSHYELLRDLRILPREEGGPLESLPIK